jgi:hypothetical protein
MNRKVSLMRALVAITAAATVAALFASPATAQTEETIVISGKGRSITAKKTVSRGPTAQVEQRNQQFTLGFDAGYRAGSGAGLNNGYSNGLGEADTPATGSPDTAYYGGTERFQYGYRSGFRAGYAQTYSSGVQRGRIAANAELNRRREANALADKERTMNAAYTPGYYRPVYNNYNQR